MKRFGSFHLIAIALALGLTAPAAETNTAPDFKEVYELVRSHIGGMSETDLNRAAVEGFFTSLRGKVSLVGDETSSKTAGEEAMLSKADLLEEDVAYVRIGKLTAGTAGRIRSAYDRLSATNKLKGVVLDLRFAEGQDYSAAADVADLFIAREAKLFDWGTGMSKSKDKKNAIDLPAAVLINRETIGAPEALAAALRETGTGLLLGGTSAGSAMTAKEYPLSNGQRLRIASSPVKLADGSAISAQGVKPDIEVTVSAADERAYLNDPYALLGKTTALVNDLPVSQVDNTNRSSRRIRATEADLVRARREGTDIEELARSRDPEKPLIRDPALARAVDVLKGLAVVRRTRS